MSFKQAEVLTSKAGFRVEGASVVQAVLMNTCCLCMSKVENARSSKAWVLLEYARSQKAGS